MAEQIRKQRPQKHHETDRGRDTDKCVEVEPASTDTPSGQKSAQKRYDRNHGEAHRKEVQEKNDEVLNDIDELLEEIEEPKHFTLDELAGMGHITVRSVELGERVLEPAAFMLSYEISR